MHHHHLLAILCVLATASACGPTTLGEEGSDTDASSGGTTSTEPAPCSFNGEVQQDGQEVQSPDGCVTYVCEDGSLLITDDRRITVAGDLELPTQEAVDEQSCLGVVEGTLLISGTAADLGPLASLYRVGGELQIIATEAVTLAGLEGLTEIDGSITLADNASLTTLAFQPYMSVFGDVTIQNNDALASLAGAEFIGQCGSCIGGSGGPRDLTEHLEVGASDGTGSGGGGAEPAGDGFGDQAPGGTFFGNILIADNDVLADVLAISNLYSAWANVTFTNNAVLTSLVGLQLYEVRGNLEISDHPAMSTADVEAFAANLSVLGTTTICGNLDGVACP